MLRVEKQSQASRGKVALQAQGVQTAEAQDAHTVGAYPRFLRALILLRSIQSQPYTKTLRGYHPFFSCKI